MLIDIVFPLITTAIALAGFILTNMRSNKSTRELQKARDIENAKQQEKILNSLSSLASKDYLDERLKEELFDVKSELREQMDDLKYGVREQINELKLDIRLQQEITQGMSKDVVRAVENVNHANERITATDKRIDDLRELFLANNKKA